MPHNHSVTSTFLGITSRVLVIFFCGHLVPKPDTPKERFIIDASNVSEGRISLNGEMTKAQAILPYGFVTLPNIRGVLTRWDSYRRYLRWSELLIFKEDIFGGAPGRPSFSPLWWIPTQCS